MLQPHQDNKLKSSWELPCNFPSMTITKTRKYPKINLTGRKIKFYKRTLKKT